MAITKTYWLKFGSGDPRTNTGMSPTFLQFFDNTGQTLLAPGIAEIKYGGVTASGVYGFSYLISSTQSVYFLAFSVTLLTNANDRYVTGVIDPILAIDQNVNGVGTTLVATGSTVLAISSSMASIGNTLLGIGNTVLAIGNTLPFLAGSGLTLNTLIGTTASSFGTSLTDPSTVFGYLKRLQEFLEGDNVFTSNSGQWLIYSRSSYLGITTLLRTKTVINTGAIATKLGV